MFSLLRRSLHTNQNILPWSEYFRLNRSQKFWERTGGLVLGGAGFFGSSIYFGTIAEFDPLEQIMGMDPMMAYGLACITLGGTGTALGIMGASQVWRLVQKKQVVQALDAREKEFFHRIANKRPKQIKMSINNPMPDYYGEKIKSVQDYRAWLKKQREWKVKMSVKQ